MQRLHPIERISVELAYFGGRTYREVAAELGEPEGTVKSRIRSGLKRLRTELVAAGVNVGDV
jgi:RNA polymerase sigma-70 factor (ECF subfamily)